MRRITRTPSRRDSPAHPGRRAARASGSIASVVDSQPWNRVAALLREASLEPEKHLPRLRRFVEAAITWNRSISNLFSINDERNFVGRHLIESLAGLPMARRTGASSWLDIGSGAGLPAIPLALCGIGQKWTLVESRRTKTLFLSKFVSDMSLRSMSVVCDRAEHLTASQAGSFDAMTSRATLRAAPTIELAAGLLGDRGQLLMWKGSSWQSELPAGVPLKRPWRLAEVAQLEDSPCVILRVVLDESG